MGRTLSEIQSLIEENDIKFIRLSFCDIFGVQKNIAIMANQLKHASESGISFDASAIEGFTNVAESDLFLFPDLDTFTMLPWRPQQDSVARVFCNIKYPDGRIFEGDGRHLLASIERKAFSKGYSFLVGPECEFYLFETDEDGWPTKKPFDRAGYFDMAPMDRGENIRRQICLTLENMGIQPERSHHEHGPGQNEIDFRCSSPLRAADDLMALKTAIKAVSSQNGLFASFLPKPFERESGSGLHINLSIFENGENLFRGFAEKPDPKASSFIAGILRRIREIAVFSNPLPGSYQRIGRCEAPSKISWSCQNRSSLVRVPAAKDMDSRMELRNPDPSCNPYYLIYLLLAAGFEGIEAGLELGKPADLNLFESTSAEYESLPRSLREAVEMARSSEFLHQMLPERVMEDYLRNKEEEAVAYSASEDAYEYEMERYFPSV